ncbi:hypothetical protein ACIBH1_27295 [Nonomuraea sp. NPDC050663]|uniref:hypothetical protein n=1 Tax=Nonomuraea sp. NPDC050663 TaxID=3364370 RepID=UPI00378CAE03
MILLIPACYSSSSVSRVVSPDEVLVGRRHGRGSDVVVTHPGHQILAPDARARRDPVDGVAKIMEAQVRDGGDLNLKDIETMALAPSGAC